MENRFYICEEYWLVIFEKMVEPIVLNKYGKYKCGIKTTRQSAVEIGAQRMTRQLGMKVTFCEPKEPILVLQKNGIYWNVIVGEKIGWIVTREILNIKPLCKIL
jgi:hypothetical protein